jgi:hypothetical protein
MPFSYRITPRPPELGGGHKLTLMENDVEVGGGVFPPTPGSQTPMEYAQLETFCAALAEATAWLNSR